MSLGQIIRNRREEMGLTLDEVAARIGFSKPYLSTIETGRVRNPPRDGCLYKLEQVLQFEAGLLQHIAHLERMPSDIKQNFEAVDAENRRLRGIIKKISENKVSFEQIDDLLGDEQIDLATAGQKLSPGRFVPIINKASAGQFMDFDDLGYPVGFADDYARCPDLHDPNAFAVRVFGDSMEPKFREGDLVIFSPAAEVHSGDDCFIRLTLPHESTFKRVYFEADNQVRLQPRNQKYAPTMVDGRRINGIYRAVMRYEQL
ncbi:MAG: helix-turn-helix domain-containing protein [Sedimentisphaerales bacterium]|nr:helix-turn-helix domain-containing protein [Sedimentisphaerales bacterium]